MPSNRLKLDFSLQTTEERLQFLNSYLPTLTFNPNEHETETLSDYILWGKNAEGLNAQQEGFVTLKKWAPATNIESLDGLMEIPGFQEARFQQIGDTHYSAKRIVFNREDALSKASTEMRAILEDLFEEIDRTELIINFYDIKSGKRKDPPREALLNQFESEEIEMLQKRAASLTQRRYLQLRHYLVELRTEQYTYRDSIQNSIMPHAEITPTVSDTLRFDEDIQVQPIGLLDNSTLAAKIFQWPPSPESFTENELKQISDRIWHPAQTPSFTLNFGNPDHILILYRNYTELLDSAQSDPDQLYTSTLAILRTLNFYESMAHLSDLQRDLLHLKISHYTNNQIREVLSSKYGTAYNENYISTIYRQKILPTIAEAAALHRYTIENIFYPENFKVCKDCGRLLLRVPEFFMRQKKSADGFAPRCKDCQKILREKRKVWNQTLIKSC